MARMRRSQRSVPILFNEAEASSRGLEGGAPLNEGRLAPHGDPVPDPSARFANGIENERVRLLVEAAHDPFVATADDGTIIEWNAAAQSMFGIARDDALGQTLDTTILPPEARATVAQALEEVRANPGTHKLVEVNVRRREEAELPARLTLWAVNVEGRLTFNAFVHDLSERLRFQEELRRLAVAATTDQGTGLKNRRGFFAMAEHELNVARRLGQTLTLIFFDLDRLKTINDTLGHLEGDRAIADTARILASNFRESDLVARLGGDEFCVLALGSEQALEKTIDRLEESVAVHNASAGRPYTLSLSYGVAFYEPAKDSTSLDDLISAADTSMYERKLGRDRPA
jgi:diguanylate cyclase (GGDEF)-like protein/PAS domain S-box-containing protein